MTEEQEQSRRRWREHGLFIPAGLFIGMGIGWALGNLVPGLLAGLGSGFLALAILHSRKKAGPE